MADFYPQSMDAREAWIVNFLDQLENHGFATKYGVSVVTMAALATVQTWYTYWVTRRHSDDAYGQQTSQYFNTVQGSDAGAQAPSVPEYVTLEPVPAEPKVGIEKFIRDMAREIKAKSFYATADGEAMGIEAPKSSDIIEEELQPTFKATTREAFDVGVTFTKQGMSAVRFEYRHKGGAWMPAGVVLNSPGSFTVAPATPGEPEQVELRAIYMKGNNNIGIWSDFVAVFVGP